MFTSALYDPCAREPYGYLIKHRGIWRQLIDDYKDPEWDDEVTDVISMPHTMAYSEHRWRMKNGRRYLLREPAIVKEQDLTLIMLQVEAF